VGEDTSLTFSRWFSFVFTYTGPNHALQGFFNAIILVMETGFAVTAFLTLFLNLILPEEIEDEETPELTANTADEEKDEEEWARIRKGSVVSQPPRKSVTEASGANGVKGESSVVDPEKGDAVGPA
jgi:uric acid-xanthine permease